MMGADMFFEGGVHTLVASADISVDDSQAGGILDDCGANWDRERKLN